MTAWGETNEDALRLAPTDVSRGKRLGFLEALEAAYNDEYMTKSQFGAEIALRDMEEENLQRIQKASGIYTGRLADAVRKPQTAMEILRYGDEPMPGQELGRGGLKPEYKPYTDVLEAMAFGDRPVPPSVLARDKQLTELQKQYPDAGILTYSEMHKTIIDNAKRTRLRASRDTSWGGSLGWFIGGTAGAVDPRVNPVNFLTLPIGGGGSTVVRRMGSQALGQGVAETIAQFTGARYNQRLLGFDPTMGETALAIGGAAVGGAAIQGVGEAVGSLARRWFRNTPDDPAPPPPAPVAPPAAPAIVNAAQRELALANRMAPTLEAEQAITRAVQETLGKNPNTMRAARSDFAFMREQLSRFDGPMPWEVKPPTSTRLAEFPDGVNAPRMIPKAAGESVDDIARRVDPETFKIYDNLAAKRQEASNLLDQRGHMRDLKVAEETKGLRAEIAKQEARLAGAKRRKAKEITATLETLRNKLGGIEQTLRDSDTVGMAAASKELDRLDEKIADMSSVLGRAYSRAQGKWETQQHTLEAVKKMIEEGRTEINMPPHTAVDAAELAFLNPPSLSDVVPELRMKDALPVAEGKDAIDEVQRMAGEILKRSEELLESFRGDIKKLIKPAENAGDEAVIQIEGFERPIKMTDEMIIERADGTPETISVKAYLQRLDENEEILKAVTTCSAGAISATA